MAPDNSAVGNWLIHADRTMDWSSVSATVLGLGRSGFASADALLRVGAAVKVVERGLSEALTERAAVLSALGAEVLLGQETLPAGRTDLLLPSPGLAPAHPWITSSGASTIWSGEALAWRLRPVDDPAPWLVITGTNGKTTTVEMVAAILRADGRHAVAVGNVGRPLVEAVFAEPAYDVLPVELSSFQLHWTSMLQPHASALLNIARDHTDWHGGHDAYVADKAKVYSGTRSAIIYNDQDPVTGLLAREANVTDGCRGVGFTLGVPSVGMVGVVDGVLVDRAFVDNRQTHAVELIEVASLPVTGQHNVANALAAAALTRSLGIPPASVRRGLRGFKGPAHRMQPVGTVDGIRYVDDSKATNAGAADVALRAFDRVVWVAGGLAKGGQFDDLVQEHRARFAGVVLLGADRRVIGEAIRRHAPEVPVIEVDDSETDPMDCAVRRASALAQPGDTVLLSPGCASMDQFTDYAARGAAFQAAVARLSR